jgi:hypothetical protein
VRAGLLPAAVAGAVLAVSLVQATYHYRRFVRDRP